MWLGRDLDSEGNVLDRLPPVGAREIESSLRRLKTDGSASKRVAIKMFWNKCKLVRDRKKLGIPVNLDYKNHRRCHKVKRVPAASPRTDL
jgi:hypothetical protein